jgi:hypothetical protein
MKAESGKTETLKIELVNESANKEIGKLNTEIGETQFAFKLRGPNVVIWK